MSYVSTLLALDGTKVAYIPRRRSLISAGQTDRLGELGPVVAPGDCVQPATAVTSPLAGTSGPAREQRWEVGWVAKTLRILVESQAGKMTKSAGRWIRLIGAGVVAAIVIYLLFELIVVAIVSAAVASLVTFAVLRYLEGKKPVGPTKPDPRAELIGMLDRLLDLNLRIREGAIGAELEDRLEGIIDKLRGLLEDLNQRHPGHDLTWTVNQMAKQYLSKVTSPYLALTPKDRRASRSEFLRSLDGLESEVDNVADLVRGEKMGDFKAKAAFLRARFVQFDRSNA